MWPTSINSPWDIEETARQARLRGDGFIVGRINRENRNYGALKEN